MIVARTPALFSSGLSPKSGKTCEKRWLDTIAKKFWLNSLSAISLEYVATMTSFFGFRPMNHAACRIVVVWVLPCRGGAESSTFIVRPSARRWTISIR